MWTVPQGRHDTVFQAVAQDGKGEMMDVVLTVSLTALTVAVTGAGIMIWNMYRWQRLTLSLLIPVVEELNRRGQIEQRWEPDKPVKYKQ